MVADIEKAFLQIGLQPTQRDVTRFVWLKDIESPLVNWENIQEYRFCRVPFGVISSPFLLGATVENHLRSYDCDLANKLRKDIYVDNVISGANTVGEAIEFYNGAKTMFQDASMNLREWSSNSDEVTTFIPQEDRSACVKTKVLGHIWNTESDTISLKASVMQTQEQQLTKRSLLKAVASVFDPQGLFSPVLLRGKLLLQTLWSKGLDWDEHISQEDEVLWAALYSDLKCISEFHIQRCISLDTNSDIKYKLLCFCDASSRAYAAAIYLHQTSGKNTKVDLMFSKTRLTPVKGISIPRAELLAVIIGVRCLEFVKSQLRLPIDDVYLWTDSQCTLKWINTDKDLKVFVKNRVNEIKSHSDFKLGYVSTRENPVDIATHGTTSQKLQNNELWWHGPHWLTQSQDDWPEPNVELTNQTKVHYESGLKKNQLMQDAQFFQSADDSSELMSTSDVSAPFEIDCGNYSSVTRLFRVTAFVLRFINKVRHRSNEIGVLTSSELQQAKTMWLCFIQRKCFSKTFQAIDSNTRENLQKQLGLYIDDQGILRCKGRLDYSDLAEGARRPILLPNKEYLTRLMIERIHKQNLHSGVSQTLSKTRYRYWIPHGRATVRAVLHKCLVCRRNESGPYKMPPFAPFPYTRVTEATPFARTGLDYLGPIFIRTYEGAKKVWVCLLTCLVTRAVHLELVNDMTTEEFLLCLRRFISQRGTPVEIISDNAKQFKVANQILDTIWCKVTKSKEIQTYASNTGITWNFITELAPWMGGFYERLVGLVKRALRKTLGRKLLTCMQLQTLLKEVEAILNSRPLVYVGDDINSSITLTPGHFLSLNHDLGIPELEMEEGDADYSPYESTASRLISSWKKGQKLLNAFWKIWRDDYLLSLRERNQSQLKTGRIQSNLSPSVGDIVLVKEDIPRGCWKLAKIVSLISSRDKNIRSAKVKLSSGRILGRPLNLLYPLEINANCETNEQRNSTNISETIPPQNVRPKRSTVEETMQRIRKSFQS